METVYCVSERIVFDVGVWRSQTAFFSEGTDMPVQTRAGMQRHINTYTPGPLAGPTPAERVRGRQRGRQDACTTLGAAKRPLSGLTALGRGRDRQRGRQDACTSLGAATQPLSGPTPAYRCRDCRLGKMDDGR